MRSLPSIHDYYELCVQSPTHLAPLLRGIHGSGPCVLGEDFAGTAALAHEWVRTRPDARAVAVDLDKDALAHRGPHERLAVHAADVRAVSDPCDVLFVGNFSIGYLHTRADLIGYLRHARSRLSPGGAFVCDIYGGESAFVAGEVHRDHWVTGDHLPAGLRAHRGKRVRYTWEQRDTDPLTGMVTDVLHFRLIDAGGTVDDERLDAFVYRWRLWGVPELRDAMAEAGFVRTEVYAKLADAIDDAGNAYATPVTDPDELDESFIVLVVARA